jgi:hypothetical protein
MPVLNSNKKKKLPNLKKYNKKFRKLEKEVMEMAKDPYRLNEFWSILDINGNGKVSLAEIDKLMVYSYPKLNNKKALMRAYKQTCLMDGGDGDAWVEPHELPQLLVNLFYFNKLYAAFIDIDRDFDRRLDKNEFYLGAKKLGLKLKRKAANKEFEEMDANDGGVVLFDEFCVWYTKKINPEREIATCTIQFVDKQKVIPRRKKEAFVQQEVQTQTQAQTPTLRNRRELNPNRHRTNKPNFNLYLNSSMM